MSKKANGISKCHYAKYTVEAGVVTFQAPQRIPDLENLTATDKFAEGKNYADNVQNIYEKKITGATLSLEFSNVSRKIESDLAGHAYDAGEMEVSTTDIQSGVAVLYQKNYNDGSYDNIIYYNCKLSKDGDSGQTQGESITYQGDTLSGEAIPLSNGKLKYVIASDSIGEDEKKKAKLDNFFNKVQFKDVDHTP